MRQKHVFCSVIIDSGAGQREPVFDHPVHEFGQLNSLTESAQLPARTVCPQNVILFAYVHIMPCLDNTNMSSPTWLCVCTHLSLTNVLTDSYLEKHMLDIQNHLVSSRRSSIPATANSTFHKQQQPELVFLGLILRSVNVVFYVSVAFLSMLQHSKLRMYFFIIQIVSQPSS